MCVAQQVVGFITNITHYSYSIMAYWSALRLNKHKKKKSFCSADEEQYLLNLLFRWKSNTPDKKKKKSDYIMF